MQSELDLLKQRIIELEAEKAKFIAKEAGLMARIVELEQSAKEKAENVKLRDAELNARIVELEQLAKESENRFAKLEQKRTQVITNEQEVSSTKDISPPIEDQSGKDNDITLDPISEHNSTQTQRSESKSLTDPESSITSLPQDIIDDDTAETLDFVETVYKEQVSKEIIERIREKKLRDQELLSTPENNVSCEQSLIQEKCQEISVTKRDDRQKNFSDPDIETKEHLSQESPGSGFPNHNIYVTEEPNEIEPTKSQCIEQGLTKQLRSNRDIVSPVSLEITEHQLSQVTTQRLVRLFQNAIRARHEEILSWYYYSDSFENKVIEICRETGVTDKTARTQLYKEMLSHLPGITSGNLRMKTLRAKKIRMLFGKDEVGIEKIKQVTYSIYAISSLTNSQIQNVIKNVTSVEPLLETATNNNHVISKTVTKRDDQTNAKVSVSSIPPTLKPITEKALPEKQNNPIHDHVYFRNKTLLRYSGLYKTIITEKNDYYGIIEGSLCPMCKQSHEDGKSVKGRYEAGSYFIKCGKHEIEIA
ncbi:hypothetical protein Glove_281g10 [Diversispora epigaea]|uniref:Uncharacterized protein n=1 Tax=Diversispora epigaea TaxID=1348612 RepID=A0A397I9X8_9GLOM|nr:hypothetical protein Glove_281g10 [Diversispora epigaea]